LRGEGRLTGAAAGHLDAAGFGVRSPRRPCSLLTPCWREMDSNSRFRARHEDEATGAVLSLTFSGYQRGRFAIMIISSPPLG